MSTQATILPIVQYNHPVLRQVGAPVTDFGPELQNFAASMLATLENDGGGIGLAAQQVGRALQMFILDMRDIPEEPPIVLNGTPMPAAQPMPLVVINPKIEATNEETEEANEGCLSFPGIRLGGVKRPTHVRMHFTGLDGKPHTLEASGLTARCIQHEDDHLQGILFIDRVPKASLRAVDRKLKRLAKANA